MNVDTASGSMTRGPSAGPPRAMLRSGKGARRLTETETETVGLLERRFELSARGSDLRTEILAGVTTFLTMAYIVLVNPAILGQAGMPVAAVAAATCLAAGFASILMGASANMPLALAPGMGLNAYFAFTVVGAMGVPWQVALGCVFISGVAFLLLTFAGIRQLIIAAIPPYLFAAVAGGIGLFIGFIGLKNAGIVVSNEATSVALGDLRAPGAALALARPRDHRRAGGVEGARRDPDRHRSPPRSPAGRSASVTFTPQPYDLTAIAQTAFQLDLAGVFFGPATGSGCSRSCSSSCSSTCSTISAPWSASPAAPG